MVSKSNNTDLVCSIRRGIRGHRRDNSYERYARRSECYTALLACLVHQVHIGPDNQSCSKTDTGSKKSLVI